MLEQACARCSCRRRLKPTQRLKCRLSPVKPCVHVSAGRWLCNLWEEMCMSTKPNLVRRLQHLSLIWISPGELSGDAEDNNTKGSLTSLQTFQRSYSLRAWCSPVLFGLKTHAGTRVHADPYTDPNTHTHTHTHSAVA